MATLGPAMAEELQPWDGSLPSPIVLKSLAGAVETLADHGDQVVLVHFFATWCEPCRDEMAALNRLAQRFEGQPLAILAVDSGEPQARIRRFFQKIPVEFPILLDLDQSFQNNWEVRTLPTTFVLAKGLRPLRKAVGEVAWDSETVADIIGPAVEAAPDRAPRSATVD